MIIREAILADASAIAQIQVDAWRTTYCDLMPADFLANLSYQQRANMWTEIFRTAAADNFTYRTHLTSYEVLN
ncbi:hypothetical protein H6G76_29675 [Nostoc sp. FACHB-152]|uniref:hypothetical protein n=1 Tax=unclassified Nostoc TaxID=2593658 RepID=UPI0016853866|nr:MULTISPECIES: hypothetical protein [unclassified Nostoc]MBD2451228.1 hypothetical protein [Nostoc sp. FACHB-152]MBD2472240.1 hypothetical protein [Nostoc sp. FACHB-145]